MYVITHEIVSTNLGGAQLIGITLISTTIRQHKCDLLLVTIGIRNDWFHIVLTQPLGDIRKVFGAFIEKNCVLHIICAYIIYLHFDVVLWREIWNLIFSLKPVTYMHSVRGSSYLGEYFLKICSNLFLVYVFDFVKGREKLGFAIFINVCVI